MQKGGKVAPVGPFSTMQNDLMGSWTMMGKGEEVISVAQGMEKRLTANQLINARCAWNGVTEAYIEGIGKRIGDASVAVVCLGEYSFNIGKEVTTTRLSLPEEQLCLLEAVKATGKPVVVLFNGRPLVLDRVLNHCDALLEVWYPGTMGSDAVVALLLGERAPSGKLTQTFPRHVGQVSIAYIFRRTFGRVVHNDLPDGPQFPFGYGLTYTSFGYGAPAVERTLFAESDTVRVKLKVTNTGSRTGREVVQLYVRDEVSTVIPREKELKGFSLVELAPGETKEVAFDLPSESFKVYSNRMARVLEPGKFQLLTIPHAKAPQGVTIEF